MVIPVFINPNISPVSHGIFVLLVGVIVFMVIRTISGIRGKEIKK